MVGKKECKNKSQLYIYIDAGQPNNFGLLLIRGFYVNFRMDLHIKPLYIHT